MKVLKVIRTYANQNICWSCYSRCSHLLELLLREISLRKLTYNVYWGLWLCKVAALSQHGRQSTIHQIESWWVVLFIVSKFSQQVLHWTLCVLSILRGLLNIHEACHFERLLVKSSILSSTAVVFSLLRPPIFFNVSMRLATGTFLRLSEPWLVQVNC